MPDVSVIVPARNAARSLGRTLAALERQDLRGEWEVIVVDDASLDTTAEVARNGGATLIRLPQNSGAAAARNAGAAAARADLLAFTDADCEPTPGWLSAGLRALEHADLVQGAVRPTPGVQVGPLDRTLWVTRLSGLWESANLLVRRSVFERAGGFPTFLAGLEENPQPGLLPRLGEAPMGEDVWFGWRVIRAGGRPAFCPDALVEHEVTSRGALDFVREARRRRHFPALARRVPELRDHFFFLGVFLDRRSAAVDLALAAAAAAVGFRSPWPLLAAAPYARAAAQTPRPLAALAADVITLAALVRGSVAARTLVL